MAQEITIKQLFEDHLSLAWEDIAAYEYPYEVLADIGDIIKKIGAALPADRFEKREGDIWVAKNATVAPTACLNGPLIIDEEAEIRHCAFIRGNVIVGKGAVVGNSTELKNVILFDGVQVPHYNYVGDSILGYKSHMGAGSITCNYDGVHKHKTVIGKDAFIGSDTMMVAPAQIGDGALVAAGSVITEPVPADALGLGRARQVNIEGWAADYRRRLHEDDEV